MGIIISHPKIDAYQSPCLWIRAFVGLEPVAVCAGHTLTGSPRRVTTIGVVIVFLIVTHDFTIRFFGIASPHPTGAGFSALVLLY